jgi:glycosyl transferase family 87
LFEYLKRPPILAASIPIVAVLAIQAATKIPSEWISVFVAGSRSYVGGRDIYAEPFGYLYPPFMALLFTPFVPLPQLAARLIYVAISIACIVGLARSAWIVSGGQTLPPISRPIAAEWKIALTGALCAAPYILNALAHMQVDVMIDCLVAVGCLLLIRGQGVAGAVLIGIAAAFKGPPLLFAAYLIFRRQWLSAGALLAVAIGLNLLPDLFVTAPDGRIRLLVWLSNDALPVLGGKLGSWNGVSVYNQSIAGTFQRLLTTTLQPASAEGLQNDNPWHLSETLVKAVAYGAMVLLLLASMIAAVRGQALSRHNGRSDLPSKTALEFAAVTILMLLMSPMCDLAHLGILILPLFCLARLAFVDHDRVAGAALILAAACAILRKDLIADGPYTAVLWGGAATWCMVALWAGCVWALARGRAAPPALDFTASILTRHRAATA